MELALTIGKYLLILWIFLITVFNFIGWMTAENTEGATESALRNRNNPNWLEVLGLITAWFGYAMFFYFGFHGCLSFIPSGWCVPGGDDVSFRSGLALFLAPFLSLWFLGRLLPSYAELKLKRRRELEETRKRDRAHDCAGQDGNYVL